MLQYAVPPSLLEDCITYSCYIMNNFHIQKNRSVSATEEVTTNIPDFSRVVPFYSKGFAHVSQEERKGKGKMTPKAIEVRFIGFPAQYKDAYEVYIPQNHTTSIRHDVKFNWE